jgi:hypothetical protein
MCVGAPGAVAPPARGNLPRQAAACPETALYFRSPPTSTHPPPTLSPTTASTGTAATSPGSMRRHSSPFAGLVPQSGAPPLGRALATVACTHPSASAAWRAEGHTRPVLSTSGAAPHFSARFSSAWKGAGGSLRGRGRGFQGRSGSPGGRAGAHASLHRRLRSEALSGWRRRRERRPVPPITRRINPAAFSPTPSARCPGPLHPCPAAQRSTRGTSAPTVGPCVLPCLSASASAHRLPTSGAEGTASTACGASGRAPLSRAGSRSTVGRVWHGRNCTQRRQSRHGSRWTATRTTYGTASGWAHVVAMAGGAALGCWPSGATLRGMGAGCRSGRARGRHVHHPALGPSGCQESSSTARNDSGKCSYWQSCQERFRCGASCTARPCPEIRP